MNDKVQEVIVNFLNEVELDQENYFNDGEPWEYDFGGNIDDGLQHGYESGINGSKEDLYNALKDIMDLSGVKLK